MKAIRFLALASALIFLTESYAQFTSGENVVISNKVDHDLYVAGETVSINSPIEGDLIIAGGTITISDTIAQDVLGAGSNMIISGYVADDVRCAGGTIKISNNVAGDVIVTGGTIIIDDNATVEGNLMIAGGKAQIDGDVKGYVKSACGELTLNGEILGDIDCRAGKISVNGTVGGSSILAANTIELGSQASFSKDVAYWNKEGSLDFGNSIHGGEANFDSSLEPESGKWHYLGFASFLVFVWYLGTALLMISLMQYFFGGTFKKAADTVKNTSLRSLGFGVLFLISVPVAIFVTFVTIVGIPLGILSLIGFVVILVLGTVIVALIATHWINNTYYHSAWRGIRIVFIAFLIFVVLKLASLTPFIGPAIMLLLACMAFGGILQNIKWRKEKQAPSFEKQTGVV